MSKIDELARKPYHVLTHSGRKGGKWRVIMETDSRERARRQFDYSRATMKTGSVMLLSSDGIGGLIVSGNNEAPTVVSWQEIAIAMGVELCHG